LAAHATRARAPGRPSEKGHDGEREWESNDYGPGVLTQFPLATGSWTFWGGKWGVEGGPDSPGHQRHFNHPEEFDSQQPVGPAGAASATASEPCTQWLGGDVTAVRCRPGELRASRLEGRLGQPGDIDLRLIHVDAERRAATAPGLAQLVGEPLRAGHRLEVTAPARSRPVDLLLRYAGADGDRVATFPGLDLGSHGRATIRIASDGHPVAEVGAELLDAVIAR
jgi:hypothetical protein